MCVDILVLEVLIKHPCKLTGVIVWDWKTMSGSWRTANFRFPSVTSVESEIPERDYIQMLAEFELAVIFREICRNYN